MSAPRFAPTPSIDESRSYQSPPAVARPWVNSRPGAFGGFQPVGEQLGFQGPDQGFALKIAHEMVPSLHLQAGEHAHDVVRGCLGLALRRASMFSRGPVVHDLTVAFTVWGYLNPNAPAELVAERRTRFAGLGHGVLQAVGFHLHERGAHLVAQREHCAHHGERRRISWDAARRRTERFAGWSYPPQEEVPVSSSCSMQGLLIAENAG